MLQVTKAVAVHLPSRKMLVVPFWLLSLAEKWCPHEKQLKDFLTGPGWISIVGKISEND